MPSEHVDEVLLVRFLLGNLTEAEQVEVEDRAFADPNYLTALEAAEADLIDSYVQGELSPADRRDFERRFMTSPGRLRKLEFARALATVAAESKAAAPAPARRPSGWQSMLNLVRGWTPAFQFAAGVAAVICVAAASWLMVQNAGMRARVAELEAQRRALSVREQELRRDLAAQSQKRPAVAPPAAPATAIATLVFLPGLTRAEMQRSELVLNPSTQIARIDIQLEPRDDYPQFRAELRTAKGEEILAQSNLRKRRNSGGYSVSLDVPASVLSPGEYELALKGFADAQPASDIGYYYFRVRK